mgnify:CR=1 FL=1
MIATLAMAAAFARRTVKSLHALLDPDRARSTLNDFFIRSPWPAPEILRSAAMAAMNRMNLQRGERIQVILDASQKAKRGTRMDALGWVREAGSKEWRRGHRFLLCYLRVRGVMIPWAVDLCLSRKFLDSDASRPLRERLPGIRFRALNEMAADIIRALPSEWRERYDVVVLLDSGFCNETVCGAVRAQGFRFIVAAQASRVLVKGTGEGRSGRRVVLGACAHGCLRYQGRDVTLPPKRSGGRRRRFRVAEVVGRLRGLGEVKVVFSRRESDGSVISLACSDTRMDAREVALEYGWRREIEVATKGLKGCLGLGQYQCRYYEGMLRHLRLSLLAHLLLTVAELHRRGHDACKKQEAVQLPSIRVLQSRLRLDLCRDLLARIRGSCSEPELIEHLLRALGAA